jgi:hypothetical protein
MRWSGFEIVSLVAVFAVGCQGSREDEGDDGGLSTIGSDTGDGTGAGTGPMKFDVVGGDETGEMDAGDEAGDEGCQKVDFLFVIDSSNSLKEEQAQLIGSFPGFVSEIQATVTAQDYHVGVVTSDAYAFNGGGCTQPGSLVIATGGKDSSMSVCGPFADGFHFMTENEPDLDSAFACTAQIGTGGANDEAMFRGLTEAISPPLNAQGACNDSFIRQDALLVVVLITDEDDPGTCILGNLDCEGSPGDPPDWFQNVIGIKGNEQNVVVLSLVWGAPNNVCGPPPGTEKLGQRVMDYTNMFTHGFIGDICAPSYDAFFAEAVSGIDMACDEFIPPG